MKNEHLQRTLKLLRRTGDKGFLFDSDNDDIFVLMNVDAYEDMLDQVDGDGGKSPKKDPEAEEGDRLEDYVLDDIIQTEEQRSLEAAKIKPEEIQKEIQSIAEEKPVVTEDWAKKPEAVVNEESLHDVPHEEGEEEKFYLEPVE